MKTRTLHFNLPASLLALSLLLLAAGAALAQTPVDEDGNPVATVVVEDPSGDEDVPRLSAVELETLVGPIALYPDDLLAIVLSASTYPLEIVQAARFLEALENDSSLQPDEDWDDSVVALVNYPEVVNMMNDDIDWTWSLGEAVVAQQADVVAAVESFRDRAYAAGNLESDDRQTVARSDDDVIEIQPVEDDVIYVPYYEPAQVVIRQPRRVYYYYPDPYPVYYYPYPAGHHFASNYFWGVTTAFRIGWSTHHLHVHHQSFHGHPYFGWNYYDNYYWRRPSITVFNTYYGHHSDRGYRQRYGSYWRPRHHGGARPGHYQARSRYYSDRRRSNSDDGYAREQRRDQRDNARGTSRSALRDSAAGRQVTNRSNPDGRRSGVERERGAPRQGDAAIRFRQRDSDRTANRRNAARPAMPRRGTERNAGNDRNERQIEFRARSIDRSARLNQREQQRRTAPSEVNRRQTTTGSPNRTINRSNRNVTERSPTVNRGNRDVAQRRTTSRPSPNLNRQRSTATPRISAPSRQPARQAPASRPRAVSPSRSSSSSSSRSRPSTNRSTSRPAKVERSQNSNRPSNDRRRRQ